MLKLQSARQARMAPWGRGSCARLPFPAGQRQQRGARTCLRAPPRRSFPENSFLFWGGCPRPPACLSISCLSPACLSPACPLPSLPPARLPALTRGAARPLGRSFLPGGLSAGAGPGLGGTGRSPPSLPPSLPALPPCLTWSAGRAGGSRGTAPGRPRSCGSSGRAGGSRRRARGAGRAGQGAMRSCGAGRTQRLISSFSELIEGKKKALVGQ